MRFQTEEQQAEYNDSIWQDSLTQEQYASEAVRQYAGAYGADKPDTAWILSPYDTWEPNPHYTGPKVPNPEEQYFDQLNAAQDLDNMEARGGPLYHFSEVGVFWDEDGEAIPF